MKTLGGNIKYWRKVQGMSQIDLGVAIGLGQVNLSQYEHNRRVPTLKNLARLAKALQVSIMDLLKDTKYVR